MGWSILNGWWPVSILWNDKFVVGYCYDWLCVCWVYAADKAHVSSSSSDAELAQELAVRCLRFSYFALSLCSLLFCFLSFVALKALCTSSDKATPGGSVLGLWFPGCGGDAKVMTFALYNFNLVFSAIPLRSHALALRRPKEALALAILLLISASSWASLVRALPK